MTIITHGGNYTNTGMKIGETVKPLSKEEVASQKEADTRRREIFTEASMRDDVRGMSINSNERVG